MGGSASIQSKEKNIFDVSWVHMVLLQLVKVKKFTLCFTGDDEEDYFIQR